MSATASVVAGSAAPATAAVVSAPVADGGGADGDGDNGGGGGGDDSDNVGATAGGGAGSSGAAPDAGDVGVTARVAGRPTSSSSRWSMTVSCRRCRRRNCNFRRRNCRPREPPVLDHGRTRSIYVVFVLVAEVLAGATRR